MPHSLNPIKKKVRLIVQTPLGRRALTLRGLSNPRSVARGSCLQGNGKQVHSHYPILAGKG